MIVIRFKMIHDQHMKQLFNYVSPKSSLEFVLLKIGDKKRNLKSSENRVRQIIRYGAIALTIWGAVGGLIAKRVKELRNHQEESNNGHSEK